MSELPPDASLRAMIRLWKYVFARVYEWKKASGFDPWPEATSIAFLSFLLIANFFTALFVIEIALGVRLIDFRYVSDFRAWALFSLMTFLVFWRMTGRGEELSDVFSREDERQRRRGTVLVVLYIVVSLLSLVIAGIWLASRPQA